MRPLVAWISPHDSLRTVDEVVAAVEAVRRRAPRREARVAIPTAYGPWLQGTEGMQRSLGDDLAPATLEDLAFLRTELEARGVPTDGWCVPRGTGDCAEEGRWHGEVAALFDRFYLNLECGWDGFWTRPRDPEAARAYLGAFWTRLEDLGRAEALDGQVGCTWIVNLQADGRLGAMPRAMSAESMREWVAGTSFDLLETYGPGGEYLGALDPARDLPAWRTYLRSLGIRRRALVPMLAPPNNWRAQAGRWGRGARGAHLWTLASAAGS
jgi:hypothetical protein